ncbi:MAG: ABC transporter permease [Candidatus Nezhaarchaeota archaeon]|nr:ABC transporter permease [Candidatus Nezhaarchaeota archaeon]
MVLAWEMAFKNLRRRRLRTALTVLGIVVGVSMMLILLSLASGMESQARVMIRALSGADIVVTNATTLGGLRGSPEVFVGPSLLDQSIVDVIRSIPGVYAVSPQLSFSTSISGRRVTIYGIEPSSYEVVTGGLRIAEGRFLSSNGEIVLGRTLTELLNLTIGSSIVLSTSEGEDTIFKVVGIFESGVSFQELSGYMTLADAQYITGRQGLVSQVLVKCNDPSLANQVASLISSTIDGIRTLTPSVTVERASQVLSSLTMFFVTIGLVALVAGSFGVVNTMMMSVTERTWEIGVLKAIGAKDRDIMKMFLAESLLIGLLGGCIGVLIGMVLAYVFPALTAGLFSYGVTPFWTRGPIVGGRTLTNIVLATPLITPLNIATCLLLGALVGILAGLYPAWRASRLRPAEAMRRA